MTSIIAVRPAMQVLFLSLLILVAGLGQAETEIPVAAKVKQMAELADSVRGIGRKMYSDEAAALEQSLAANPDDLSIRAKLIGYYFYQGVKQEGPQATIKARRRHVTWLIRNHPDSPLGGFPETTIDPAGHRMADKVGYETASAMWRAQVEDAHVAKQTLENAFNFLRLNDKAEAEKIAHKAHSPYLIGQIYALGMLRVNMMNQNGFILSAASSAEDDRYAEHAIAALRSTEDMGVLDVATSILLTQGAMVQIMLQKSGKTIEPQPIAFAGELLERCTACHSKSQYYKIMGMMSKTPEEQQMYAKKELALLEKDLPTTDHTKQKSRQDKELVVFDLGEHTQVAFNAKEYDKAARYANELLGNLSADQKNSERYGKEVHTAHIVLGRIALVRNDIKTAGKHLLDAGNVKGSPTLRSFGPNMALAKELLEHGERDVVVVYLKRCQSFWDLERGRLGKWIKTIESGDIPDFGANLIY